MHESAWIQEIPLNRISYWESYGMQMSFAPTATPRPMAVSLFSVSLSVSLCLSVYLSVFLSPAPSLPLFIALVPRLKTVHHNCSYRGVVVEWWPSVPTVGKVAGANPTLAVT